MAAVLLKLLASSTADTYHTFGAFSAATESVDRGLFDITGPIIFTHDAAKNHVFGLAVDCLPMTVELAREDGTRLRGWLAVTKFRMIGNIHGENVYAVTLTGKVSTHEAPNS